MKKEIYICDECGAERKEANHWFVAGLGAVDEKQERIGLALCKWESLAEMEELEDTKISYLCGQACVHKFVDWYMSRPEAAKAARVEVNCER